MACLKYRPRRAVDGGRQVSDLDDFVNQFLPRQIAADRALHNGDAAPRMLLYSHDDPITVFGAWFSATGWEEVTKLFELLASRFTGYEAWDFDLVNAGVSGDVAYTVGFERSMVSIDGRPMEPGMLRVTHGYRREEGEWKIAHRHGDSGPRPPKTQPVTPTAAASVPST